MTFICRVLSFLTLQLSYNILKKRASDGDLNKTLSAPQYLICSAEASSHSVLRLVYDSFSRILSRRGNSCDYEPSLACSSPHVHYYCTISKRISWFIWFVFGFSTLTLVTLFHPDGLTTITRKEGPMGLFRGTSLGLVGVSNGAVQFVVYEKMKAWAFDRRRRQAERAGIAYDFNTDKLVSRVNNIYTYPKLTISFFFALSRDHCFFFYWYPISGNTSQTYPIL